MTKATTTLTRAGVQAVNVDDGDGGAHSGRVEVNGSVSD